MPGENPGAYDEARKRIRENKERETVVIEEKKESFEKGKEKIRSRKKLDVFELRRRIETGQSLEHLKSDIKEALQMGEISAETYRDVLEKIKEDTKDSRDTLTKIDPDFKLSSDMYPLAGLPLTKYFEGKRLGDNILVDMAGVTYGFFEGSIFLLWLTGRVVLDALLLPLDIYSLTKKD